MKNQYYPTTGSFRFFAVMALGTMMVFGSVSLNAAAQEMNSTDVEDDALLVYRGTVEEIQNISRLLIAESNKCERSRRSASIAVFRNIVRLSERQLADTSLSLNDINYLASARAHGIVLGAACR